MPRKATEATGATQNFNRRVAAARLRPMSRRPMPGLAEPLSLAEALRASEPLGRLAERLRRSSALFAAVAALIPPGLAAQVHAGPVDDEGWSLLCANAAVAAKLRQIVPHLQQHLQAMGLPVAAIRVKVQPR